MDTATRGSYAGVAAAINKALRPSPKVIRQQVYTWHTRQTRNAAGMPFPEPVERDDSARRTRPRLFFDYDAAIGWYRSGLSENSVRQLRNRRHW